MKKLLVFFGVISALTSATPEQVDRYLLVSGSEDQLMQFEQMVDTMGQMFATDDASSAPLMQDSQLLSIRFREFIQRNLSEDEMDEVMENYKHDVLRKLVSAQVLMEEPETVEAYHQFLIRTKKDPLPANRTEVVKSIVKKLYDEKTLIEFFDKMYLPMMKQIGAMTGKEITDKQLKKSEELFVKKMHTSNYDSLLFMTRDFESNELDELNDLAGNSASSHETRTVFGAVVFAMEEAIQNMTKRFSNMLAGMRHPPVKTHNKETNASKTKNNTHQ